MRSENLILIQSRTFFLYLYKMEKGFLILIITFIIVGIIHFISMRTMKLSETKKNTLQKVLLVFLWNYFYVEWSDKPN